MFRPSVKHKTVRVRSKTCRRFLRKVRVLRKQRVQRKLVRCWGGFLEQLTASLRIWRRNSGYLKMSSKSSSNNLALAKRVVQQLRVEASIERVKVSKASADLMRYCSEHAKYDPLLMGIPASENPFKDKKPCILL
ncbi:hypothetical protein HF521_009919 [Silurus meridionalis]|uniref:Guanine nucleotide-binding protein subunit gamma n=2 Tax=Silurus meridionalis TaxID=175797 RepID=A0A8T0AKR7_SILME|nr:hypothetical protein HF521_009919 [Silurus meridionalis]